MPLVVITGIPSSGKTTTAVSIMRYLESKGKRVYMIQEEAIVRSQVDHETESQNCFCLFNDPKKEKMIRSELKGKALQHLTKDAIVILDGLNYIKGFRYELWCASKSLKTTQLTVHCDVSPEDAWKWNVSTAKEGSVKKKTESWPKDTFDALVMRYEAPNSSNRWDSPLFLSLKAAPLDLEVVEAALFGRKPPPPNQSTQCQPLSSANFSHELDRVTATIIKAILEAQKLGLAEDCKVPGTEERVLATRNVTVVELTKAKRQFIIYAKARAIDDISKLATMFVQYLNSSLFQ